MVVVSVLVTALRWDVSVQEVSVPLGERVLVEWSRPDRCERCGGELVVEWEGERPSRRELYASLRLGCDSS